MSASLTRALLRLQYKMQTIPLPKITPTEMLLKVGAAGYCHTDTAVPLNVFGGPFPLTGSHEPAGTVVAVGAEVEKAGKFKVGDRVMAVNTCKKCGTCRLAHVHAEPYPSR